MPETYDPDGLATVTVQIYNRQLGLLAAEKGRSRYIRAAFHLLEDGSLDPWMRAGGTPGDALRRALAGAKRAGELDRLMRKTADILYYNRGNPIMEKIYFMIVEEGMIGKSGEPAAPGGGVAP